MGSSLIASCECGYTTDQLIVGGGMRTFSTIYIYPAFCSNCRDLAMINLRDETPKCDLCGSDQVKAYGDESLRAGAGSVDTATRPEPEEETCVEVADGTHLCPECGEFKLKFKDGGIRWD